MSSSSIHDQNTSSCSPEPQKSAVQKWINPSTGKPDFSRHNDGNLEQRTVAAAELFHEGYYRSVAAASRDLRVPYDRLLSRTKGAKPTTQNGGNNTLLTDTQEQAVLCWAHRRVTQGHHIQLRSLQHNANAILRASGHSRKASHSWAKRFMKRWKSTFYVKQSMTRDVRRKAMQDRAHIEAFFYAFEDFVRENNIKVENIWNFDETGFMIGYLQKGTFVWTFREVEQPILTDAHTTISVTAVEAISAAGASIPPFIIMPCVNIPVKWVQNRLSDDTAITTSSKGYVNDILALEWAKHFERLTRPSDLEEKRLLLMDGCENHFTHEIFYFCSQHNIELFPMPPHLTHHLQPLDVGVFNGYKQWHQHILYREIANGANDFNKTDFLYHLQEIRERTFRKSTIISAWEKCGLFPHNPAKVLDNLKDPLSSLTADISVESLPGHVEVGSSSVITTPPQQSRDSFTTPVTQRVPLEAYNWGNAATPPLRMKAIEKYQDYVMLRMHTSITSGVPLTPSVMRVFEHAVTASNTLALNGITATQELHRLKEKATRRSALQTQTSVIAKYGPITVGDARLRVLNDEHNRQAAQADEKKRILRRDSQDEGLFLRRWIRDIRSHVRPSITAVRLEVIYSNPRRAWKPLYQLRLKRSNWWSKTDRRCHLASSEWLAQKYALHRQLQQLGIGDDRWQGTGSWPRNYDPEVVQEAVNFAILNAQERAVGRKQLTLEADGIEVITEDVIENSQGEFLIPKDEEDD